MSDAEKRPIFIIGPARSGTTIITQALRNGAHLPGYYEGHFLLLLKKLTDQVDAFFHSKQSLLQNDLHMIAHVNKDALKLALIEDFKRICEELCPEEVWLDKSPDALMIQCIDNLRLAWPACRFIFAKRRGIENICSRLRKFPNVDFESHCRIWANTMQSWLDIRDDLAGSFIEVEQREIALNPNEVAALLVHFLGLEETHTSSISSVFTINRPQSTGEIESSLAISIDETGWTNQQIQIFREICGDVSAQLGYGESSAYYQ